LSEIPYIGKQAASCTKAEVEVEAENLNQLGKTLRFLCGGFAPLHEKRKN
jgi:hypothetical protein